MRLDRKGTQNDTDDTFDLLVIACLNKIQKGKCAHCRKKLYDFQLHHKQYGENINIYDLELIHKDCHGKEHGHDAGKGLGRKREILLAGRL